MESTLKRTWAEIDLDALTYNYRVLRHCFGDGVGFMGVVKADSYGHGAVQVGRAMEELGFDYLAVSNIDEARELRIGGVTLPILQLGLTSQDQVLNILANDVTQVIYSETSARAFACEAHRYRRRMKAHIKLDTGMSRLGFPCDEEHFQQSLEEICRVAELPGLVLEGVFTHFAVADGDSEEERAFTLLQHRRFLLMLEELARRGVTFSIRHCANSGAVASYPQLAMDMVRPGLLTYGIGAQAEKLGLKPLMRLKSTVGCVKEYGPGATVSYGRTFRTVRPTRVGVLPIGYADGIPRALSNNWQVWTQDGPAPIIGRICMDMCMVDLTELPGVREGAEVTVYGPENTIARAADMAGTIPYELTCAVSRRVPRIYHRSGREVYRELLLRG